MVVVRQRRAKAAVIAMIDAAFFAEVVVENEPVARPDSSNLVLVFLGLFAVLDDVALLE
jgi:hypothetical protein